jgi:hypothetical protein
LFIFLQDDFSDFGDESTFELQMPCGCGVNGGFLLSFESFTAFVAANLHRDDVDHCFVGLLNWFRLRSCRVGDFHLFLHFLVRYWLPNFTAGFSAFQSMSAVAAEPKILKVY